MSTKALMDRALQHHGRGDFHESVRLATDVLAREPNHPQANGLMGEIYAEGYGVQKDTALAKKFCERARRAGEVPAVFILARIYDREEQTEKAKGLFLEAYKRGHADAALHLGGLFERMGKFVEAIQFYSEARDLGVHRATLCLGKIHERMGNSSLALTLYQEGDLADGCVDCLNKLAVLAWDKGDLDEAFDMFQEGSDRGSLECATNLGKLCEFIASLALKEGLSVRDEMSMAQSVKTIQENAHVAQNLLQQTRRGLHSESEKYRRCHEPLGVVAPSVALGAHPLPRFHVGDVVRILGLTGSVASTWNGSLGEIQSYSKGRNAFSVDIRGVGVRSIKAKNIELADQADSQPSPEQSPVGHAPGSSSHQAVEQDDDSRNAEISNMVLQNRLSVPGPRVEVLTFSRSPNEYRKALMDAPELADCRQALEDKGFAVELSSGAKVFVQPQHYEPLMVKIRMSKLKTFPRIVFVDPSLAAVVIRVLERTCHQLPQKQKFYNRSKETVPLAFAAAAAEMKINVLESRTFVDIQVPSSLPSTDGNGTRVVSTTDTNARKGRNPRRCPRAA